MLYYLLTLVFLQTGPVHSDKAVEKLPDPGTLNLVECLPVDDAHGAQLSGLTLFEGKLLTISDKDNHWIFEISIHDHKARLVPFFELCSDSEVRMDFEGITKGEHGEIYLVSEHSNRVMAVFPDQNLFFWVTPSLTSLGRLHGLLNKRNAGIEGLAFCPPNLFVAAAERQDRGLLSWEMPWVLGENQTVSEEHTFGEISNQVVVNFDHTRFTNSRDRNLDFSGLFFYHRKLLALERNNHLVSVINGYREGDVREGAAWSYDHVENDPAIRYSDRKYGIAEGLCVDDRFIYIVLDHNGDHREANPDDHRPALFIFKKPAEL